MGKFDDVGVAASVTYQAADSSTGALEDLEFLAVGAKVDFAGFSIGANWHDANETNLTTAGAAAGADAGSYWAVGAGYSMGPWGIGAWYSDGSRDHTATTEVSVTRWGIGGNYAIAPGWRVSLDVNNNEHENKNGVVGNNNDSRGFAITQTLAF